MTLRRILASVAVALAALVLLPYVLVPLYAVVNPVSTLMLADLVRGRSVDRQWMPLDRISDTAIRSVVSSEDAAFCTHHGLDFEAIDQALKRAERRGRPSGGASTITQQLAKNLFFWPQRSWLRKVLETPVALWLDLVLSKRRILEIYLNVAEWGPGTYGIEAGARRAFGRPAADLTYPQAAIMATALPNPILRDPKSPSRRHLGLSHVIERRAREADPYVACLR